MNFTIADEHASLLDLCGDEKLTGYQLRDIMDENRDLNVVKRKIGE